VFSSLGSGAYALRAEKSGLRSRTSAVSLVPGTESPQMDLVLDAPGVSHSDSAAGTSSPEALTFADKPGFTVAGITDWTAVGGHGSDTALRTSEALARETATLKPEATVPGARAAPASETETKLRAALAKSPDSFEANHQLGEFCFHEQSYREAIPLLDAAYNIDPANRGNEYDLALAEKAAGDLSQARDHIRRLLTREDNADLHRLSGDLDEETGDSLSAVREYEQAVRLDPSEQNYFKWGSELLLHRAVRPAVEVFEKGARAHPGSARMLAALSAALFAGGQYNEAALRLCAASDLNPADTEPYIFLGQIDIASAAPLPCVEPKLARFVQEHPGDVRANYYYAMSLWKRQKVSADPRDLEPVESLLTKATALDPAYAEAFLQLGVLYFIEQNYGKAIGFYSKAIQADPQLSEAHYRLGVAYERTQQPAKARQEFQLHDQIEKQQAAAVERQRREIRQFLIVLNRQPASSSNH